MMTSDHPVCCSCPQEGVIQHLEGIQLHLVALQEQVQQHLRTPRSLRSTKSLKAPTSPRAVQ
jgi:hypothetical protein